LHEFLFNMAVCHAVVIDTNEDTGGSFDYLIGFHLNSHFMFSFIELLYKSQSPDESALCDGARKNGFRFARRTQEGVGVLIDGIFFYLILFLLKFDCFWVELNG
jgi:hypothetical protein